MRIATARSYASAISLRARSCRSTAEMVGDDVLDTIAINGACVCVAILSSGATAGASPPWTGDLAFMPAVTSERWRLRSRSDINGTGGEPSWHAGTVPSLADDRSIDRSPIDSTAALVVPRSWMASLQSTLQSNLMLRSIPLLRWRANGIYLNLIALCLILVGFPTIARGDPTPIVIQAPTTGQASTPAPTIHVRPCCDGFIYFHVKTYDPEVSPLCDSLDEPSIHAESVVRITASGQHVQIAMTNPCIGWEGGGHRNGYQIKPSSDGIGDAYFRPLWAHSGKHRVGVATFFNGKLTRRLRYTITARVKNYPAARIYLGEDDFVNICINEGRQINSSGGVLYCTLQATSDRKYSLRRGWS